MAKSAGLSEYADAVVDAVGERAGLVVVAHSLGGFTAPLVCARVLVDLLVLVAGMVPAPGETSRSGGPTRTGSRRMRRRAHGSGTTAATPRCSSTTSRPTWPPRRSRRRGISPLRRCGKRGRSMRGRMSRPGTCCVEMTGCFRPTGPVATYASGWVSLPTRSTAATRRTSAGRWSWPTVLRPTAPSCRRVLPRAPPSGRERVAERDQEVDREDERPEHGNVDEGFGAV
jgi:hypothetical protein